MREVTLDNGVLLRIGTIPFEDAKSLYQAILEEARGISLDPNQEIVGKNIHLWKDVLCVALSSKKVEAKLWKCFEQVRYGELKIDKDTFEPEEARGEYFTVCWEVTRDAVAPFLKSLSVRFKPILDELLSGLKQG